MDGNDRTGANPINLAQIGSPLIHEDYSPLTTGSLTPETLFVDALAFSKPTRTSVDQWSFSAPSSVMKTKHLVCAMAIEIFAILALGVLLLSNLKKEQPLDVGNRANKPILLVHGYMGNEKHWGWLFERLKEANIGEVHTINLKHFGSIDKDHSAQIEEKVKEIQAETGCKEIILVGHSMGGIVSSYFATHNPTDVSISDVITIGSPLRGTPLAYAGLGACAKQMRPGSELLSQVHEKVKESTTRFFNISSRADQIILSNESSLFDKTCDERITSHTFEDMGHATYLFSPAVAEQLIHYIRKANS